MKSTQLTIVQGTPFKLSVRVTRKNEAGVREPFPLPGASVRLQARTDICARETLLDLSSKGEDTGITLDEDAGTFIIYMSSEWTSSLRFPTNVPARPVFQCEVTLEDGESMRVLSGTVTLDPEVVR
jgi:hypothetical protein